MKRSRLQDSVEGRDRPYRMLLPLPPLEGQRASARYDEFPVELWCEHESFGGYNDDCYCYGHDRIRVRYPLWDTPTGLIVCKERATLWNAYGRHEDSRLWIRTYVMLITALPRLACLRGIFREFALKLRWPTYEILDT